MKFPRVLISTSYDMSLDIARMENSNNQPTSVDPSVLLDGWWIPTKELQDTQLAMCS